MRLHQHRRDQRMRSDVTALGRRQLRLAGQDSRVRVQHSEVMEQPHGGQHHAVELRVELVGAQRHASQGAEYAVVEQLLVQGARRGQVNGEAVRQWDPSEQLRRCATNPGGVAQPANQRKLLEKVPGRFHQVGRRDHIFRRDAGLYGSQQAVFLQPLVQRSVHTNATIEQLDTFLVVDGSADGDRLLRRELGESADELQPSRNPTRFSALLCAAGRGRQAGRPMICRLSSGWRGRRHHQYGPTKSWLRLRPPLLAADKARSQRVSSS